MNGVETGAAVGRQLRAERGVTLWGLAINVVLTVGKIGVGLLSRSSAIVADGLHSTSDLASDVAVLWGIHAAKRPADADHHYGHARYEAIVALFVGLLLIAAACYVGIESLLTIGHRHGGIRNSWPFWVAVASIVLKECLYWLTRAVGRRYCNPAIVANAWHHRSDAFSSIAAAAGIAGTLVGGPRWAFLDHLTAVVLAAFLIVIGIRIARDSLRKLADTAPNPAAVEELRRAIAGIPDVRGHHALRARCAGAGDAIEMDVHVQVDPSLSVGRGHDIATLVEEEVRRVNPGVASVVVHVEPAGPAGSTD